MIPLRSLAEVRIVVGPPALIRYNNLRAVTIKGARRRASPRVRRSQAMERRRGADAAGRLSPANGPTPRSRRNAPRARRRSSSASRILFAYLFLVALYESWTIPVPVLLSVTVGVLGSFVAILIGRLDARSLCPDRHGRADRACGEERHPDRRVRQGADASTERPCSKPRPKARVCGSGRS